MRPSEKLGALVSGCDKILGSPLAALTARSDAKSAFLRYLAGTATIIRASVDLMEMTRDILRNDSQKTESVFEDYLTSHIEEEKFHFEWVCEDLRSIAGATASDLIAESLTRACPNVPGFAYYYIRNVSPVGLLGYMFAMESQPPNSQALLDISGRIGAESSAIRTLELHAIADPEHTQDLARIIDLVTVAPEGIKHLSLVAAQTCRTYFTAMMQEIEASDEAVASLL
jgi:hypothetical protein